MMERQLQDVKKAMSDDLEGVLSAVLVLDLIREIEERDQVIADMQQEQAAFDSGRKAGHDEALAIARRYRGEREKENKRSPGIAGATQESCVNLGRIQASNHMIDAILEAAGLRSGQRHGKDHPARVREENNRLKAALRRIADGTIPAGNTTAFHAAVVLQEQSEA